ncbi:MAG: hypothetical protein AB7I38_11690 [Dehalococcoidia bacterium]
MDAEIIDLRQLRADHAAVEALRAGQSPPGGGVVVDGLRAWQRMCASVGQIDRSESVG